MCPLITRICLLHRLGATGEDVFKEAPVRPATQEAFAQRHIGGEVHYGVGCEVVDLCPKEIQKPPEERVGAAKKTHGRRGWPEERTHPPEAAALTPSPGAAPIHGGSALHQPGRRDPPD